MLQDLYVHRKGNLRCMLLSCTARLTHTQLLFTWNTYNKFSRVIPRSGLCSTPTTPLLDLWVNFLRSGMKSKGVLAVAVAAAAVVVVRGLANHVELSPPLLEWSVDSVCTR